MRPRKRFGKGGGKFPSSWKGHNFHKRRTRRNRERWIRSGPWTTYLITLMECPVKAGKKRWNPSKMATSQCTSRLTGRKGNAPFIPLKLRLQLSGKNPFLGNRMAQLRSRMGAITPRDQVLWRVSGLCSLKAVKAARFRIFMAPHSMLFSCGARPKFFVQCFRRGERGSREKEARRFWRWVGMCGAVAGASAGMKQGIDAGTQATHIAGGASVPATGYNLETSLAALGGQHAAAAPALPTRSLRILSSLTLTF